MSKLGTWSCLEEALRYLSLRDIDDKTEMLQEQFKAMRATPIGKKLYSPEIIIRAFEYFCTSRALYTKLRQDYAFPSIRTLTRITSKVGKLDECCFLKNVFENLTECKKLCALMFDEVYVKKALLFHGGSVFGKALNHPSMLAKSVLGVMVESLLGGPTFLSKMLPVTQLNSEFMLDEISKTIAAIEAVNGEVKVLICDKNRVNQKLFKIMDAVSDKPWLTKAGRYLSFDFVHLLKSLRNNWLTERSKELLFYDNGVAKVAKWVHLETLFNYESVSSLTKLSKLDEVSVYPKPIERQKVSTCLKIFCEETRSALLLHPEMANVEGKEDTASFINMVVTFFRIVNVKSKGYQSSKVWWLY